MFLLCTSTKYYVESIICYVESLAVYKNIMCDMPSEVL